ncbi:MAG: nitroreductase family protein [Candidatus Omnitrophica bacterium]|nr:nitroreductase family protein [Candidatus Omnitrophota bacterium]MDD5042310.1 nitroreductase family protein [Candidatus Omnitrophota bacterium]MDD5500465.1 nitroreductase family protein [Candidatus Omnitrophota bacterium]
MITIEVNKKTCVGDGKCVEICPMHILKMNEKERVPEFVPGGGEACINCGQCFAFCPKGSIKLSTMDVKDAMRLDYAKLPNAEQTELLLKSRRSIRNYKDEPVAKETIEKLLDIARYAPTGINRQPVSWIAVMGKDKVRELGALIVEWIEELLEAKNQMAISFRFDRLASAWKNGEDLICRNAPCIVIAQGIKDDPLVPQSCTIAATYLELAAFGLGLGACWAGYVNMAINMSEKIRKFTGLSSHATAGAVMMIGHPKYRYSRIPLRNPAKISWK